METFDGQSRGWEEGPGLLQSAWRYKWMVATAVLLGMLLGYGWTARQPTLYEGVSRLLLSVPQSSGEPARYLRNQAEVIGFTPVLKAAADHSGRRIPVKTLRQRMSVEVAQDSDLITIHVLDRTPQGAAELAAAVARAYQDYVAEQSRAELEGLRAAQSRLEKRLANIDAAPQGALEGPLAPRRAAVMQKLAEIETQILAIGDADGSSRVQLTEDATARGPVQPATRRTMAGGALLGLVVSVALAWSLNSQRAAQAAKAAQERFGRSRAFQTGGGSDLTPDAVGDRVWSAEPGVADEGAGVVPAHNGARFGSAAPLARKLAREYGIDLNKVPGTGLGGRVRPSDVEAFRRQNERTSPTLVDQAAKESQVANDRADLIGLFSRLDTTLDGEPLDFYVQTLPQAMAEEVAGSVPADMVAVLLDTGEESFRVAGAVGVTAEEHGTVVDRNHDVLRQALEAGGSVFQDTDRPDLAAVGLPGSGTADALVMVPLVQGPSWLGMLLVGRRSDNDQSATAFSDQEITEVIGLAGEFAFTFQTLLLLHRIQQCLGTLQPSLYQ
jgi:capsular polysaccharide biosynthesis protein